MNYSVQAAEDEGVGWQIDGLDSDWRTVKLNCCITEYSFLVTSVIECLPLRFILFCKQYSQFGIFSEMYKTSSVAYASSK